MLTNKQKYKFWYTKKTFTAEFYLNLRESVTYMKCIFKNVFLKIIHVNFLNQRSNDHWYNEWKQTNNMYVNKQTKNKNCGRISDIFPVDAEIGKVNLNKIS